MGVRATRFVTLLLVATVATVLGKLTQEERDECRDEIENKLVAAAEAKHGGDIRKLMEEYDVDKDGKAGEEEIMLAMDEAGIEKQCQLADGVVDHLDKDQNGILE